MAALPILMNAGKPLTIDDPAYYYYARQIAHDPTDPYGFLFFGHRPAQQILAPPVLPYWLAAGLNLFGDRPFLWKLWLFPFALLLVFALHALCRRFAAGLELPLAGMTVLSPALLRSWNLMLDVPALALSLAALALFIRGADRASVTAVSAAGLLAGLAMQTKYTGFVAPAVIFTYALVFRHVRLASVAVALALVLFVAWECFLACRYGESHFLYHLHRQHSEPLRKLRLVLPLLATLGGVAPWGAMLSLAALGVARRWLVPAAALLGLGYLLLAVLPQSAQHVTERTTLSGLLFGTWGAIAAATTLAVVWRLLGRTRPDTTLRVEWFLLAWLGLEVAGYFALTPFPAVRRILGMVVVGALVAGRLLATHCQLPQRRLAYLAMAVSAVLGFGFFAVDVLEARAQQRAAEKAAHWVRRRDPDATVWCIGTQGFPFYADRNGMRRLVSPALLRPGDWLVSDGTLSDQERSLALDMFVAQTLIVADALPLRTHLCFYSSGTPLEHHAGPRARLALYRKDPKHHPSAE
jgi:hypothetical protein